MKIEKYQALQFFMERGFKFVPCYSKEDETSEHSFKSPKTKGFTSPSYKGLTVQQAEKCFVGLVIPEGYQILDLDMHGEINGREECKKVFEEAGIEYKGIINTTLTQGKHLFFKLPPGSGTYTKCGKLSPRPGIDGRKNGNYVCAYSFSGSLCIQELTSSQWAVLLAILNGKKSPKEKLLNNDFTGFEGTENLKVFVPLQEKIYENEGRNVYLASYAGHVYNTEEITIEELIERVEEENQRICIPPLPYKEVLTISKSIFKYKKNGEREEKKENEEKDSDKKEIKKYQLNDIGSAEWLLDKLGDNYRWCPDQRDWYHWLKNIWKRDNSLRHGAAAIEKIKNWYEEEKDKYNATGKEVLKKYIGSIKKSYPRIERLLTALKNYVALSPDDFDFNDNLLNFENGVLNLETEDFREHRKEDYQTKKINCDYCPEKEVPEMWLDFLNDIFLGDKKMIDYVQKIFGLSLCAKIGRQEFFILYGGGGNGKSQFIAVFQEIFGNYTYALGADKIMENPYANNDTYFAQLANVRVLFCTESKEGAHLNVALVKKLTDEHMELNVAQKFERARQFKLKCMSFLITNHKPVIRDTTKSAWRRIKLIPFTYDVPDEKKILRFADKLLESGKEGICNWFIQGYKKATTEGIEEPEKVKASNMEYKKEQNELEIFISEKCDISEEFSIRSLNLLAAYNSWHGRKKKAHVNDFTPKMIECGFKPPEEDENRQRRFYGIRLKPSEESADGFQE